MSNYKIPWVKPEDDPLPPKRPKGPPEPIRVVVHCDICPQKTRALAEVFLQGGYYDDEEVERLLVEKGWAVINNRDVCPNCSTSIAGKQGSH
jgi:hypothetical protein